MKQSEVTIWELEHQHLIFKWEADWETKPEYKIVTFFLKDKSTKTFEIKLDTDEKNKSI